ncbi:hypothetical protein Taro_006248 [Colocasia esculenta]|uniref:RPA-interacting protein C-terminal domain-containing protein n=1 Tax=Colocasia esculenta TaxID=4460 RepID=A0A843U071_COLES|nr:hypothetical protein [Colocasia esculenta]
MRIKHSSLNDQTGISKSGCDDLLWEYDSHQVDYSSAESHYEELLIEMERCLYEDLREESIRKELELYEEEDEYLARAVFEHMQLNDGQAEEKGSIWCPICKQGEVRENDHHLIYCTICNLQLDLGNDKMNLEFLRGRLGEVHEEHLDKGCKATPSFFMETGFNLTALYIRCQACNTFEIVL